MGKRAWESYSCDGKVKFTSERAAKRSYRQRGFSHMCAYFCKFCHFFHIGGTGK